MTNSEEWEAACVRAGRSSGDLAHPLVYCPELHFSEFTSAVADMKNSVAVRKRDEGEGQGRIKSLIYFCICIFIGLFCTKLPVKQVHISEMSCLAKIR